MTGQARRRVDAVWVCMVGAVRGCLDPQQRHLEFQIEEILFGEEMCKRTCDVDNLASVRGIEKNDGLLISHGISGFLRKLLSGCWISLQAR